MTIKRVNIKKRNNIENIESYKKRFGNVEIINKYSNGKCGAIFVNKKGVRNFAFVNLIEKNMKGGNKNLLEQNLSELKKKIINNLDTQLNLIKNQH